MRRGLRKELVLWREQGVPCDEAETACWTFDIVLGCVKPACSVMAGVLHTGVAGQIVNQAHYLPITLLT
jgi:hypothetical protein